MRRRELASQRNSALQLRGRRLTLEPLEDRRLLATFIVTNDLDTRLEGGVRVTIAGTLRKAIESANATDEPDTIYFSDNAFRDSAAITIGLNGGPLVIRDSMDILGPGPMKVTVVQSGLNRVFDVAAEGEDDFIAVSIAGIAITNGRAIGQDEKGGGMLINNASVSLTEVIVADNTATAGGGGAYIATGSLRIDRSLFQNNSTGGEGGGGVLNGAPGDETQPTTNIRNSTFTGNQSDSASENSGGGGVLNRNGTVRISQSTFVENSAESGFGEGVASWGNPVAEGEDEEPPPPTVFTEMDHTIVFTDGSSSDVAVIGMTEDEEPMPLEPSFESLGYNIITTPGDQITLGTGDLPAGTNPGLLSDPDLGVPVLDDYGGSTPVFLPNNDPANGPISKAIDAGDPARFGDYEQRGRHFKRVYDAKGMGAGPGVIDIGAAEVQAGEFFVDGLVDETDLQYSGRVNPNTKVIVMSYTSGNDFTLREAIEFSQKNPEVDKILFSDSLQGETDPTFSSAPTILLDRDLGSLAIDHEVVVEGPTNFIVEVDASGADPTPGLNNGDGSHAFQVDDGDALELVDVTISGLTILGADQIGPGGAMYVNENLTLRHMTFRDNYSTLEGGAVFVQFGNLVVEESTFYGNSTAGSGGAIFVNSGAAGGPSIQATIINSTISGNTAGNRGAGIANDDGKLVIRHSTITNNSAASTRGSGVFTFDGADAVTEVYSSIISGNANNDIELTTGASNTTSLGYNLIGRGNASGVFTQPGDRRNILNPMLAPLTNTGGFILTHRPLPGSPVIDMGNPADVAGVGDVPATDQRGGFFVRVFDGNSDTTAVIDVGAYELQPIVLVVDNTSDVNDGIYSIDNLSLREAIAIANENPLPDAIDMTALTGSINLSGTSMTITDSLTIDGPNWFDLRIFGSSLTNARMFTIDDGDADQDIDVTIRGVGIESGRAGAILSRENLTIDEVFFQANTTVGPGGAILQENGSLMIDGSVFTGNTTTGAGGDGGAIYGANTVIDLIDTLVAGNSTTATGGDGGGIALFDSSFYALSSTISGNTAPGGASDGGGIFADGSSVETIDTTISGNITTGSNSEGGGIAAVNGSTVLLKGTVLSLNKTLGSQSAGGGLYAANSQVTISESLVAQNTTAGHTSPGGGIALQGGSAEIVQSSVSGNTATGLGGHGGGVYNVGANLTLRGVSIVENAASHAQSKGGGVYSDTNLLGTQTTTILNSTVSTNTAGLRGGGVFNADGRTDILHSTVTNNSTPFMNSGNGVASQGTAATQTRLHSSIVAGNAGAGADAGSDIDAVDGAFLNSVVSLGYNLVGIGNAQQAFTQTGDLAGVVNPMLGPLEDNGVDPVNGFSMLTHAVLEGSPAINAGSPTFNPNSFTPALDNDQRGATFPRVLRGRIDVGALESNFAPAQPADFNGDAITDGADYLTWQRNFGRTGAVKAQGDANADGTVNAADLGVWRSNYGAGAGGALASASAASSAALLAEEEKASFAGATRLDGAPIVVTLVPAEASEGDDWAALLAKEEAYRLAGRTDGALAAWRYLPAAGATLASVAIERDDAADNADAAPEDAVFAALGAALG
ncbi:MAG: hypothetical protein DCC67_11620 [Planctomycetota bacterium]|nr:MAG: hypothetical protein DCC67_11620 [Planctomycetota bacterium]